MERENFKSRLGFILISAGCAIGIGNVWKFPYLVGQYGGGMFVLLYLIFLAVLGIPVMAMEFSMGRASRKSPVLLYQQLEPKGSKWHIHGILCLVGCTMLMMYYTSVAGWMLQYFVLEIRGGFAGKDPDAVGAMFSEMIGSPTRAIAAIIVVIVLGFLVCSRGLQNGLERVTKWMMLALLIIMVFLAINSVFLKGGASGLEFYLKPDLENMKQAGIVNVIVAAMNQAFFTLSLGVGAMAIFGSYIGREQTLAGESVNVAILDTFVAVVSGLIIFPACFAYGIQPGQGPALIFVTLPNIFNNMPMGRLWGALFFVFMSFAAFSTVLAVFENIMACIMDLTGWTRGKTGLVCAAGLFILALPCALGYNVWSGVQLRGAGSSILDFEDYIVSNLLLPGGSLIFVLFCTRKSGWGWDNFLNECNTGKGLKFSNKMRGYMTWVLPVIVAVIFLIGLPQYMMK